MYSTIKLITSFLKKKDQKGISMKSSSRYSGVQQMHLIVKIKVTKKMRPAWATHSKKKRI